MSVVRAVSAYRSGHQTLLFCWWSYNSKLNIIGVKYAPRRYKAQRDADLGFRNAGTWGRGPEIGELCKTWALEPQQSLNLNGFGVRA